MQQFAIVRNVRICISIRFYKYILMEVEAEASAEAKAKKKAAKKAEEEAAVRSEVNNSLIIVNFFSQNSEFSAIF